MYFYSMLIEWDPKENKSWNPVNHCLTLVLFYYSKFACEIKIHLSMHIIKWKINENVTALQLSILSICISNSFEFVGIAKDHQSHTKSMRIQYALI